MSTPAVTPQPDNTQQSMQTAMMSPDGSQTKLVPREQLQGAKDEGWEPAVKMQSTARGATGSKWVPISQIQDAHAQGWFPVESQQFKEAAQKDAIKPDNAGNAAIIAAPLVAGRLGVTGAMEGGFNSAAEGAEGMAQQAVQKLFGQGSLFEDEGVGRTIAKKIADIGVKKLGTSGIGAYGLYRILHDIFGEKK